MDLRDLSAIERTAVWLDELIAACAPRAGRLFANHNALCRDVTRKAKALRTSLTTLRAFLYQPTKGEIDAPESEPG